jgi:hypothetical protein
MTYVTHKLRNVKDRRVAKDKLKFKFSHYAPRKTREQPWNREDIPVNSPYAVEGRASFWRKDCSICGGRALYRAGKYVYCKLHRAEAVKYWSNKPMKVPFALHNEG